MKYLAVSVMLLLPALASATDIAEQYRVCECCCENSDAAADPVCLYQSRGDDMAALIRMDDIWHKTHPEKCSGGCTKAKLYRYCDETPDHQSHDTPSN